MVYYSLSPARQKRAYVLTVCAKITANAEFNVTVSQMSQVF
jgi:hypothetical protein